VSNPDIDNGDLGGGEALPISDEWIYGESLASK